MIKGPEYNPVILRGLKINTANPFSFNFIVDHGDAQVPADKLEKITTKSIKYFLAALTIPKEKLWVNLSPYEDDRIIDEHFGWTAMGRDMLTVDYLLKKLSSSLTYPETELGNEFWEKIYEQAYKRYGATNLGIDTFSKVWIVPDKVHIYTNGESAFIRSAKMSVLLEKDYLSLKENLKTSGKDNLIAEADLCAVNDISSEIAREIILPVLKEEINKSNHFGTLRQMYHSLVLATWYKQNFERTYISKSYTNQKKVNGIKVDNKKTIEKIYDQYLKTLKEGIYNYIKEDYDPVTENIIPRKYFSGGTNFVAIDRAMIAEEAPKNIAEHLKHNGKFSSVKYNVFPIVISSDNPGSNRGVHRKLNEKFETVIKKIGKEIQANFDEGTGMYDIRGKVFEEKGKRIVTTWGELRINPDDNMLEIVDLRFEGGHAGFSSWAVYAEDEGFVAHEKTELMEWTKFAVKEGLLDEDDIKNLEPNGSENDHNLKTLLEGWLYINPDSEKEFEFRRNAIRKLTTKFHQKAKQKEKEYRRAQVNDPHQVAKKEMMKKRKAAVKQHGEEAIAFIDAIPAEIMTADNKKTVISLLADINTYKLDLPQIKTLTQLFRSPFLLEEGWKLIEEYINVDGMEEYFKNVNPLDDSSVIGMLGEIISADTFKKGNLLEKILPGEIEIKKFGTKGKTNLERMISRFTFLEQQPIIDAELFNNELNDQSGRDIIRMLAQEKNPGNGLKGFERLSDDFKKHFRHYTEVMFQKIENIVLHHQKFTNSDITKIFEILKKHNNINNIEVLLTVDQNFFELKKGTKTDLRNSGFGEYEIARIEENLKKLYTAKRNFREFDVVIYSKKTGKVAIVESKYYDLSERPAESEGISYIYPWYVTNPPERLQSLKEAMQRQVEMYLQLVLLPGVISFNSPDMGSFVNFNNEIKYLFSVIGLTRNNEEKDAIEEYLENDINKIIENFKIDNPEFKNMGIKIKPEVIPIPERENMVQREDNMDKKDLKKHKGKPLKTSYFEKEERIDSEKTIKLLKDLGYISKPIHKDSYAVKLNFTRINPIHHKHFKGNKIAVINRLLRHASAEQGNFYKLEAYYNSFMNNLDYSTNQDEQMKISRLFGFVGDSAIKFKKFKDISSFPSSALFERLSKIKRYRNHNQYEVLKNFVDKLGLDFLQGTLIENLYDANTFEPKKWAKGKGAKISELIIYFDNAVNIIRQLSQNKAGISLSELAFSNNIDPAKMGDLESIARNHPDIKIIKKGEGEEFLVLELSPEYKITEPIVAGGEKRSVRGQSVTRKKEANVGGVNFDPDYINWEVETESPQNRKSTFSDIFYDHLNDPENVKGYVPVYIGAENLPLKNIPIFMGIKILN